MGKPLRRQDSDVGVEENHPGCIWGIFHILDYHHWHTVKKILPHKWHRGRRHARCDKNLREHLIDSGTGTGKAQDCMDDEADQSVVKQSTTETNQANKRSGKARSKETGKKGGPIHRVLGFPGQPRLWRTVSIHHLEPSDPRLGERSTAAAVLPDPPILKASEELAAGNFVDYLGHTRDAKKHGIFHKRSEKARKASVYQNIMDSDQLNRDISGHQLKECVDVLELLRINKELFVKILQDPDVGIANRFHSLQTSNSQIKLTKSGSFPTADLARRRNFKPSKLEHKQNEIWSFPKREKLLPSAQAPKLVASKSSKDVRVADDFIGSAPEQEKSLVKNQEDVNHLADTKQRTENATEESTKVSNLLVHGSLSTDENEVAEWRRESTIGQDGEDKPRDDSATDIPGFEHSKGGVYSRRTSFPNDSLDRYAQLFEHGFRREGRWHHSKSLKVTNENDFPSGGHGRKTARRNLSLPEFNFYCAQPNELSSDALCSGKPSRTSLDSTTNITRESHNEPKPVDFPSSTEECVALEAVVGTEFQKDLVDESDSYNPSIEYPAGSSVDLDYQNGFSENADELHMEKSYGQENILLTDAVAAETEDSKKIVQGSDSGPSVECPAGLMVGINDDGGLSEDMFEPIMAENSLSQEQEVDLEKNSNTELAQPSPDSVLESCFQDVITTPAKSTFSEGTELKPRRIDFDKSDTLINSEGRSSTDELSHAYVTINHERVKNGNKGAYNHFLDDEPVKKDEAEFNYVRDVLELSGFTGKEYLEAWHLLDQPLSPSVFEEMEACLPHENQCSKEEVGPSCDHQLLFDLVNQALLEIYQRSFTYCPRALSYSCRVHPMPVGHHVVEAVWANIRWRLSSGQEKELTLNDVVAGDLAKDDGWMNLQSETECLALEMEDMIFHELLDEMLCC